MVITFMHDSGLSLVETNDDVNYPKYSIPISREPVVSVHFPNAFVQFEKHKKSDYLILFYID